MTALDLEPTTTPPRGRPGSDRPVRRRGIRKTTAGQTATFVVLLLGAVLVALPLYVMVMNAIKSPADAQLSKMWLFPTSPSLDGLSAAWGKLGGSLVNSLELVIPATILSSAIGAINGYVLSKYRFKGSDIVMIVMLMGMFIPYQVVLIPLVQFLSSIGLYGTIPGLILTHVVYGIPIVTLVFRNYYASIPDALLEAASIDGAGFWGTFLRIVVPLSGPGFVVAGIFQFTSIWNEFLFGLVVVPNPDSQPITVALNNLSGTFSVNWNEIMAGAVLTALPTAIVYLVLGRFFVKGLTSGAVK